MKLQKIITIFSSLLFALSSTHGVVNVNFGGGTGTNLGTDVDNWITNNIAATDGGAGLAYNWENVITNTSSINSVNNNFDVVLETTLNHTIGHGYLFNQTFDLSQTVAGITAMTFTMDFDATEIANWRPMMLIGSQQYIWTDPNTVNPFNGTNQITVANAESNASWSTILFNNINVMGDVDNGLAPNLQANTGMIQFGFIQWGGSNGGTLDKSFTLGIDQFEVDITYDAVPEPAPYGLILGAAGLFFVMLRRRRG